MFPVFKADYEEGLDLNDVLPQLYGDFCSWESGALEPCALDDHHLDALTPLASYSEDSDGTLLPNSSSASSLDSNGVGTHDSSPAVVPCFTVAAAAEPVVPRASHSILGAGTSLTVPRPWQPAVDDGGGAAMTRQERVQRYREKRKRRTFEKTIRYEARRAYAEVRPRIKGRFATKEEVAAMKAAAGCSC